MAYVTVEAEIIKLGETGSYMLWPIPLPDFILAEDVYSSEGKPFDRLPEGATYTLYLYSEAFKKFTKSEREEE